MGLVLRIHEPGRPQATLWQGEGARDAGGCGPSRRQAYGDLPSAALQRILCGVDACEARREKSLHAAAGPADGAAARRSRGGACATGLLARGPRHARADVLRCRARCAALRCVRCGLARLGAAVLRGAAHVAARGAGRACGNRRSEGLLQVLAARCDLLFGAGSCRAHRRPRRRALPARAQEVSHGRAQGRRPELDGGAAGAPVARRDVQRGLGDLRERCRRRAGPRRDGLRHGRRGAGPQRRAGRGAHPGHPRREVLRGPRHPHAAAAGPCPLLRSRGGGGAHGRRGTGRAPGHSRRRLRVHRRRRR
mmetsp:Transcript_71843/g.233490  ORF Transcript_71843/g.233490 Transcript_71843/m.233490 type:complete len:308 (-) Transcript_71843:233-1156(-)